MTPRCWGGTSGWTVPPGAGQARCPDLPRTEARCRGSATSSSLPKTLLRRRERGTRILEITDDRINQACSDVVFMVVLWAISTF